LKMGSADMGLSLEDVRWAGSVVQY